MLNADEAGVSTAVGEGIGRTLSHKIDREVRDGHLVVLLPEQLV
jgi:hypothetical protein